MSSSYETEVIQDARDLIIDKLTEIDAECTTYAAELGSMLFEEDWANNTLTFDVSKAYHYIMSHPNAAASTHDYLVEIETDINPFDEPEKFHIVMMEEIARTMLAKCPIIDENWNSEIAMNDEMIETLKQQLAAIDLDEIER